MADRTIRKLLLILLVVDSSVLVWLFGDMLAHFELIPGNLGIARYLGAVWGGLALTWGCMAWSARKNKSTSF